MDGVDPQAARDHASLRQQVTAELAAVQAGLDHLLVHQPRRRVLRRAATAAGSGAGTAARTATTATAAGATAAACGRGGRADAVAEEQAVQPAEFMEVVVGPDGTCRCVYAEAIDVTAVGDVVRRASRCEAG